MRLVQKNRCREPRVLMTRRGRIHFGQARKVSGFSAMSVDVTGGAGIDRPPPRKGDIICSSVEISRAGRDLGFAPRVSPSKGLRALIDQRLVAQPN